MSALWDGYDTKEAFVIGALISAMVTMTLMAWLYMLALSQPEEVPEPEVKIIEKYIEVVRDPAEINVVEVVRPETTEEPKKEYFLDELRVLARCVEAEAGNQDLLGKRLVVDVVLNRVDSDKFPDDIISVIYQDGQFSVVDSGMIDLVEPSDDTWDAIWLEIERRTDSDILYFRSGHPHTWLENNYQHGAHYFGY